MASYNRLDLLDIIEEYASINGLIASEAELSERFDNEILPLILETYDEDDAPAIYEGFNDWSDSLCKDGELHEEQYNNYYYIGRLA